MYFTGYRNDGFLASLSADMEAPSGTNPIIFDTEIYDYGNNYNPVTGVYTVPRHGLYLIHARVYGSDKYASHRITVDGVDVTYTNEHDAGNQWQSASTSIVLHLQSSQQVAVDPFFSGTVDGETGFMKSSFGITLLYAD